MILLYNGFYLFPLSRAVNSKRLIFDPSEVEIHQYLNNCQYSVFTYSDSQYYI